MIILFSNIYKLINKANYRVSSWDKKGKNVDFIQIKSKETRILAEIDGPGIIRHIYFTSILLDPLDFRNAIIRIYWDHEKKPSVEVPLGDFFGVSNCRLRLLNSLMMTINRGILGSYGFNMYFPMPFLDHAKIEIENQGASSLGGYFSAFWYQKEPHKTYLALPKLEDRIPRLPENYKEMWDQYITCAKTIMDLKRDLKEKFPESLDRFFEETAHNFVMGKYNLASREFKEIMQKTDKLSK